MVRSPQQAGGLPRSGALLGDVLGGARNFGAPITAVMPWTTGFAITTGDGCVAFAATDLTAAERLSAHQGAILAAARAGSDIVTGGDDGRVVRTTPGKGARELWHSAGRWVDRVAASRTGTLAWSSGKSVFVLEGESAPHELPHPSASGGLAFAPKSRRLAVAHYGGVSIWDLGVDPPVKRLFPWNGSHLQVTWSRDERFVLTAMQEGALHGWRLSNGTDFAMHGYPAKPRSLAWSRKGDWLATSGATEIVLWSFQGRGPMNRAPLTRAQRPVPVTAVAFHPVNDYIAAGYQDGAILLARREDGGEVMVQRATGAAVTALAWSADGRRLAYGTEDGRAALVDFSQLAEGQGASQ